jgi:hypothetical protein
MSLPKLITSFRLILGISVSLLVVIASLGVLSILPRARIGPLPRALVAVLLMAILWGLLATWVSNLKYRKLDINNSWALLRGPKPPEPAARAAWRWGRQAWYAWIVVMLSMLAFVLVEFR